MELRLKFPVLLLVTFGLTTNIGYCQSIPTSKVQKVKSATVRLVVEGGLSIGTGFFINSSGQILTCWHVIAPAIATDQQGNFIGIREMTATLSDGTAFEVGIPEIFLKDSTKYRDAVAYDYCLLNLVKPTFRVFPFLKIGRFQDGQEGNQIYTCGYPAFLKEQFVSSGIISTKYTDTTVKIQLANGASIKYSREQALLDLTLNKGNSGGAILLSSDSGEDEVIGIADFIISPAAQAAENMAKLLRQTAGNGGQVLIMGVNPVEAQAALAELIANTSIGISGCVSINHFLSLLERH